MTNDSALTNSEIRAAIRNLRADGSPAAIILLTYYRKVLARRNAEWKAFRPC